MTAVSGFIFGSLLISVAVDLYLHRWDRAFTQTVIAALYFAWDAAQRRVEYIEGVIRRSSLYKATRESRP